MEEMFFGEAPAFETMMATIETIGNGDSFIKRKELKLQEETKWSY